MHRHEIITFRCDAWYRQHSMQLPTSPMISFPQRTSAGIALLDSPAKNYQYSMSDQNQNLAAYFIRLQCPYEVPTDVWKRFAAFVCFVAQLLYVIFAEVPLAQLVALGDEF